MSSASGDGGRIRLALWDLGIFATGLEELGGLAFKDCMVIKKMGTFRERQEKEEAVPKIGEQYSTCSRVINVAAATLCAVGSAAVAFITLLHVKYFSPQRFTRD